MTTERQVYLCEVCGNLVEVLRSGPGTLVCCDQPMTLQKENTTDAAKEKHVPVVERIGKQLKVSVGSVLHPMTEDHYIEWIEVSSGNNTMHRHLQPGDAPEALFPALEGEVVVRAYCNLHGLWKA
ncbi:MAG: desulfoferrodoxin [Pirellulales bacterium]|nr:desulfoferrodoxin [Pirellulales bacterium]